MTVQVKNSRGDTIYLCGAPDYHLAGNYIGDPPVERTYIFTNKCYLDPSTIKGKELHVHSNYLAVTGKQPGLIDTSGADGQDNLHDSDTRANASGACAIFLSTANLQLNLKLGQALKLQAKGGDGGRGYSPPIQAAQAGVGGNAGSGADITVYLDSDYDTVADAGLTIISSADPSPADLQAWATLARRVSTPDQIDDISWVFRRYHIDPNAPDMDASGDLPFAINKKTYIELVRLTIQAIQDKSKDFLWDINCSAGKPGQGGQVAGRKDTATAGATGKSGIYSRYRMTSASIRSSKECLFHPDQVNMTIKDIENDYYMGSAGGLAEARNKMQALIARLSFLDTIQSDDNLYKAYLDKEYSELGVLSQLQSKASSSITSLQQSLSKTQGYLIQLNSGRDYYNHDKFWAPRMSYVEYDKQLKDALDSFDAIERSYESYMAAASDVAKRKEQTRQAQYAASTGEGQAESDIHQLSAELRDTAAKIADLQAQVQPKHQALDTEIDQVSSKIKQSFQGPTIKQLAEVASQMCFAPSGPAAAAIGAAQGASMIYSGATEVRTDSGESVNKEYLVNKINTMKADLDGLHEAVTAAADDPNLDVDDPGAAKLLAEENDIMNLVNQYRGVLGDDLNDLRQMFDDYINLVLQRNNEVLRYNATVAVLLRTTARLEQYRTTQNFLGVAEADLINSEIPALALAMQDTYLHFTSGVLELLHDTQRALKFWSLDEGSVDLTSLRQSGFPADGLGEQLKAKRQDIIKDFRDTINNLGGGRQAYGIVDQTVTGEAKRVYLTRRQLQALQMQPRATNGDFAVLVSIPVAYKTDDIEANPFATHADVRIQRVRFYLEGAKTSDNNLLVMLQHQGSETIVNVHNESFSFSHERLQYRFQYNLSTNSILVDGEFHEDQDLYALPGPFANWKVSVPTIGNHHLDLSGVTSAYFEFSGFSRSFW